MSHLLNPIADERRESLDRELWRSAAFDRDYVALVVLSCVIATLGLVLNSAAVIIGAMLIAPLMPAIVGISFALVAGEPANALRALRTLLAGAILAVALSAALGLLVSGGRYNYLAELPSEVLSRTQPTLFDLTVALAGGAAAAYALSQPNLSAAIPGVAIATAIMPPLCVVGIGLSQANLDVAFGAGLLFLANFAAILFAGTVVFWAVGLHAPAGHRPTSAGIVASTLFLVVIAVLTGFLMYRTATVILLTNTARTTLVEELNATGGALVTLQVRPRPDTIVVRGAPLEVDATARSPVPPGAADVDRMGRELAARLGAPVHLRLVVASAVELESGQGSP